MKALKCKPSAQLAYNYSIKCFEQVEQNNFTSIIDLRRSAHRSSIFEGRHIHHIDLRRSTHRSPKVDTAIFESRHIDLRRSIHRSSNIEGGNIAPTFRQFLSPNINCPCTTALLKIQYHYGIISDEVTHAHTRIYGNSSRSLHVIYFITQ